MWCEILPLYNIRRIPFRYEWSVGFAYYTSPSGIYDTLNEKVWQDAGQMSEAVFTVAAGKEVLTIFLNDVIVSWFQV